jgi:hypothetical protein
MLWLMMLAASMAVTVQAPKYPSIGVFIDFDAVPSPLSVDVMKREAAKIMKSAGYRLDWRALRENQGKEAFANVVVVKFHGKCRLEYPALSSAGADESVTLASTLVRDGHVLPYSDVQCDDVRRVLEYGTPPDRQKALGVALGRIVAHELYHFLADTTKHASAGLAKATHDWLELAAGAAAFRQSDFPAAAR